MPAPPSIFVGTQCDPRPMGPAAIVRVAPINVIVEGQRLCMSPPWSYDVRGVETPATHAFVAYLQPGATQGVRIDAAPGGATNTPWAGPASTHPWPTHLWQVHVPDAGAHAFRKAALACVGLGYDWAEALMQPAALFARREFSTDRVICTMLVARVLQRTAFGADTILDGFTDLWPERLDRAFTAAEGTLLTRVVVN